MDEIGNVRNPKFGTEQAQSGATRLGLNPAFRFVPLVGLLGFLATHKFYPPLDDKPCSWIAIGLCFASLILLSVAKDRAKVGKNVQSFFPFTTWLACGPAIVAAVLLLNGALDLSQVEQHHQFVADKRAVRGRWGSMTYYLEVTSWRLHRGTERLEVSGVTYGEFRVEDSVTVELHKGALALPWVARIRETPPSLQ